MEVRTIGFNKCGLRLRFPSESDLFREQHTISSNDTQYQADNASKLCLPAALHVEISPMERVIGNEPLGNVPTARCARELRLDGWIPQSVLEKDAHSFFRESFCRVAVKQARLWRAERSIPCPLQANHRRYFVLQSHHSPRVLPGTKRAT